MRARALIVMLAVTSALAHACSAGGGAECGPGDYRYCDCASASRGYELCADDATGYGACDCSGAIPVGAGVLVEAGAPDAMTNAPPAPGGFLETCTVDGDCVSKLCFSFNAYGPHCSQPCANDRDCPAPSPGCSNNHVCKLH